MSFSKLRDIESCPRRFALKGARYANIWSKEGYPPMISIGSLVGQIVHTGVATIVTALTNSDFIGEDYSLTAVLKRLGGFTSVIKKAKIQVFAEQASNPRIAGRLAVIEKTLDSRLAMVRETLQALVFRITANANSTRKLHKSGFVNRKPLGSGSFTEVHLRHPSAKWMGIADLILREAGACEITEFKTGEKHDYRREQLEIYALLWLRDSELNPSLQPATRLNLVYRDKTQAFAGPTASQLDDLESRILVRAREAALSLAVTPPPAYPSTDKRCFCDVRHLCEAYWAQIESCSCPPGSSPHSDTQVRIHARRGPTSWDAIVMRSSVIQAGTQVLLLVREPSYEPLLFEGAVIRLLDAVTQISDDDAMPTVVTVGATTEAFLQPNTPESYLIRDRPISSRRQNIV